MSIKVIGAVNDPLKKIEGFEGYRNLFIKDESSSELNETRTFKDRQPQALAKLLPERYPKRKITIAAMSTGNTAFSVAHFVQEYNRRAGKELARTVIFISDTLERRLYFGPDTSRRIVPTARYINVLEKMATVVRLNFQEKNVFGRPKYLESLALAKECLKRGLVDDLFIDVTEGLETAAILDKKEIKTFDDKDYVKKSKVGIRAYEPVIKEAIELMKERYGITPEVIVSQFGAGILYNEIVQYCKDNNVPATIIPVAVGSASSAADKIYASFWVDKVENMQFMGTAKSKHVRYPATVYGIEDWELGSALDQFAGKLDAEISGLAGLAILHRLQSLLGFDPRNKNVLVINTGNGIPNFLIGKREAAGVGASRSDKLITLRGASDLLGVHPNTLRQWESRGIIQSIRIGSRQDRKFRREEIDRILAGQDGSPSKEFAFHKGKAEFRRLFKQIADTLTSQDYYWTFAFDSEYASPKVREILFELHRTLEKKGIEDRVICRTGTLPAVQKTFAGNRNMKIRAVTADVPTGVIILPNRVIHLLWGDVPAAYEVLSAEAVRQYQNLFNGIWSKTGNN